MTPRLILAYWKTVADCLVEFFGTEQEQASSMVSKLRDRIARDGDDKGPYRDLIYHSLPIHVASDLAGREPLRDEVFYAKYQAIEERNLKYRKRRASPAVTAGNPVRASFGRSAMAAGGRHAPDA